ncbi:MAG: hypothetical protein ACREBS_01840, partial [Nitrososphaerales archaeon]
MEHEATISLEEAFVENLSLQLNEPSWLKEFRLDSLKQFKTLPEEQSNLYTKHALELNLDFESLTKSKEKAKPHESALPLSDIASGIESGQYYVSTQTETIASRNMKTLESKGVVFCDIHEALEKHEKILKTIFSNKAIEPSSDKYAALNSALFSHGWLLYVPRHVRVEDQLRIRFYLNSTMPYFS